MRLTPPPVTAGAAVVLVARAADFAARAHAGQRRKGDRAEPYVNHVIEVAALLAEATGGTDAVLVAAGYLHDVIEDTAISPDTLREAFGEAVATLVVEVSDDKRLAKDERKRRQVAAAAHGSPAAKLLRIADKIANLRSLADSPPVGWPAERCRAYVDFAVAVAVGCRGINPALDDAFDRAAAAAARLALGGGDQTPCPPPPAPGV